MNETHNPIEILKKVRESLDKRGPSTVRSLGKNFKHLDSADGNRKIDKEEFYWGLKDNGTQISKREAEILLDFLDTDNDGYVNFDEFLRGIRGVPCQKRQALIDRAYAKFDKDGNGMINAADLSVVFNADNHPKVISGELTNDEVFTDFLAQFGDVRGDGSITRAEWNDFYAAISAHIDCADHFCLLMRNTWRLD